MIIHHSCNVTVNNTYLGVNVTHSCLSSSIFSNLKTKQFDTVADVIFLLKL